MMLTSGATQAGTGNFLFCRGKKGSLKLTECVARGYEMKIRSSNDRVTDTPVMESG